MACLPIRRRPFIAVARLWWEGGRVLHMNWHARVAVLYSKDRNGSVLTDSESHVTWCSFQEETTTTSRTSLSFHNDIFFFFLSSWSLFSDALKKEKHFVIGEYFQQRRQSTGGVAKCFHRDKETCRPWKSKSLASAESLEQLLTAPRHKGRDFICLALRKSI